MLSSNPTVCVPPGAIAGPSDTNSTVRCCALTGPGPPSPTTAICPRALTPNSKPQAVSRLASIHSKHELVCRILTISIVWVHPAESELSVANGLLPAPMFHHNAMVHHHVNAALLGARCRVQVHDPLLHPQILQ